MVTEDRDLGLDDRYAFREGMIDAFRRRHLSDHVDSLSEDSPTSGASCLQAWDNTPETRPERVSDPSGVQSPNLTFVEDDPRALENVGTSYNVVILNANPRLSAALTLYRLSDHMPEHRSPLSGGVAFNVYPGLKMI